MKKLLSILLLGSAIAAGCTQLGDSPLSPDQDTRLLGTVTSLVEDVTILQRVEPLEEDVQVTATIGRAGGTMSLPEAGLRVIFPQDAVKRNTQITITARRGSNVAYTFEPHGLVFRQPLIAQQDARVTEAYKNPLFQLSRGAYFSSEESVLGKVAKVTEFRPTEFDLTGSKFKWTIEHFSGYLLSIP